MKDKVIEFINGSKIIQLESKESIRGYRSSIIDFYTPCGYLITLDCNCENCLRGDCEYKWKKQ